MSSFRFQTAKAIRMCVEDKAAVTPEMIATSINRLADPQRLPRLFMFTVLQYITAYPGRASSFALSTLMHINGPRIWNGTTSMLFLLRVWYRS